MTSVASDGQNDRLVAVVKAYSSTSSAVCEVGLENCVDVSSPSEPSTES